MKRMLLIKIITSLFSRHGGFDLGDGWAANWYGPSDIILSHQGRRYSVHVPETGRRGLKRVRTLNPGSMPRCWWRPHDSEMLTEAEMREVVRRARIAVEMFGNTLDVLGDV